ncbi:palmitoyl-protein thioesterase 1 [Hyposmocoma kahamanoa]|uniref:palmitoyl-protein thioesterase 1 n=1 Tax=Hyposmocoma kahamanoa TaxID=1477025 RepID=UPI000E6D84B4|nr:palmitoyl-protein thioesterase 1 [Hyposmocoma kahamanoa]
MKPWLIFFLTLKIATAEYVPVVLWHGMGDTCCFSFSLGGFQRFLEEQLKGVYVHSLRIGNSTTEDFENGYFMNPNHQIEYACNQIAGDPYLKKGFNAIGFSQGAQFMRGLIQRCGHLLPPVKNFISLGGQHQGVYGLPHCGAVSHATCDYFRKLLNYAAYVGWVQKYLVQATYWHDPLNEALYKNNSIFLSDINNEKRVLKGYVRNLQKLEHFVMVKFDNDTMVQPVETSWFGFYAPGQSIKLQNLQESNIYKKDRLGLKQMDKDGKLVFLHTEGDHLRFTDGWFIKNILQPYLNMTIE